MYIWFISSEAKSRLSRFLAKRRVRPLIFIFYSITSATGDGCETAARVCVIRPETAAREFDGRFRAAMANRVLGNGGEPEGGTRRALFFMSTARTRNFVIIIICPTRRLNARACNKLERKVFFFVFFRLHSSD